MPVRLAVISYSVECSSDCCQHTRADEEPKGEKEREAMRLLENVEVLDELDGGVKIAAVTA